MTKLIFFLLISSSTLVSSRLSRYLTCLFLELDLMYRSDLLLIVDVISRHEAQQLGVLISNALRA